MRRSIRMAVLSVLCASVLIITIFLAALLRWQAGPYIVTLFIGCMAALIASLLAFLRDINLALDAVRVEVQTRRDRSAFGPSRDER